MNFTRTLRVVAVVMIGALAASTLHSEARAADEPPSAAPLATQPAADDEDAPAGLVVIPDYSGDIWERRFLSGDWGGTRADWANHGIQFDLNYTQVMQSVVDGGRDTDTHYGGTLDYNLTLDLHRMGVMQGAIVKMRAESRYGETVNGIAGPILPVNTDGSFPLTDGLDDDIAFTITNLTYIQFLSEKFGTLVGKFDTLDGDPNEFASGRGTSQFLNSNFVFNSALALTAPYSTLGGGVIVMPVKGITINSLIYNTVDSSTTTGFDDLGDGTSWLTEVQTQYRLGKLPGGQNVGFIYSFDNDFTKIGGRFVFTPGEGITVPTTDDTWAAYWSAWQYLYVEDPSEAPIDLLNGTADHQGIGLFARVGIADHDTNPVEWTISGGVGGKGIIPTRDSDTFGVGYYYYQLQTGRLSGFIDLDDHTQGVEAFYNVAITPAASLTFDVQYVDSVQERLDDAVILGVRLGLRF